jgi:methionyl-tRNA formyltransferase
VRIVFCSNGGLLGDAVLSRLVSCEEFQVVGVVRSRRVFSRNFGFLKGAAFFFLRCGAIYMVYLWFITTFAEFLGHFTGHGSISRRARRLRIPLLSTRDVNAAVGLEFMKSRSPDAIVCAHFDQRLYPPLCDGGLCCTVNLHPSLLPADKGLEPVLRVMCAGRTQGVTLHRIVEGLDDGPILACARLDAAGYSTLLGCSRRLMVAGADLICGLGQEMLPVAKGSPQVAPGSYHSWPTRSDMRAFLRGRHRLFCLSDLKAFWRA